MKQLFKILNVFILTITMILFFVLGVSIGKKYDFIIDKNNHYKIIPCSTNEQKVRHLVDLIDNCYVDSINTNQLIDKTISFILQNLDPHSIYIPKEFSKIKEETIEGYSTGIGIRYFINNDTIIVKGLVKNSPNQNLFKFGDIILKINQRKISSTNIDSINTFIARSPTKKILFKLLREGKKNKCIS